MPVDDQAFYNLSPFIQDYIYRNRWAGLREIQVAACDVIFNTDSHLLLTSGTASGKTEAAFLPVLTQLMETPRHSVAVLYISPLKALINDQFARLDDLLQEVDIPVQKWHGDVSQNDKQKYLRSPRGVMQTTPESLESMLMNKKQQVIALFCDLQYIIVDEVHYFMGCDRGVQLLCIMERIERLANVTPRRIGLSATLGDYTLAEKWLAGKTGRPVVTPRLSGTKTKIRLALEHFLLLHPEVKDGDLSSMDMEYFNYIYENSYGRKCILFSNAKMELERIISTLHELSGQRKEEDVYIIHHGSLSTTLRENAEQAMKHSELPMVVGATVTLELGIDIGELERIIQLGTPFSISSFIQRLGRSGRRGDPAQMWFALREYQHLVNEISVQQIDWEFLRCIAIIELYTKERFIEPIDLPFLPYSLLYHQTMSVLYSAGEASPAWLAGMVLSLTAFRHIPMEDYKILLLHLVDIGHLEQSPNGSLMIGLQAERYVNDYQFYAVFEAPVEYTVRFESEEIGSVQVKFPIGERFALAGKTWEVSDVDEKNEIIYVQPVAGRSSNIWTGSGFLIHTRILQKIRDILRCEDTYPYLQERAVRRLAEIRNISANSRLCEYTVVKLGGNDYCILPWLGTRAFVTLLFAIGRCGIEIVNKYVPYWFIVRTQKSLEELFDLLYTIKTQETKPEDLDTGKNEIQGKFNGFIPIDLLKKQFRTDFIDLEDMQTHL
jgi:ATP-dependent Lhr-like helicase